MKGSHIRNIKLCRQIDIRAKAILDPLYNRKTRIDSQSPLFQNGITTPIIITAQKPIKEIHPNKIIDKVKSIIRAKQKSSGSTYTSHTLSIKC
jgi:hypothetical protein